MISAESGADLPRPGSDRLVLYLLGPGFGESQVIAFPDGRWMVVDGCVRAGLNLPLALLRHLGCKERIDLLVITHPDLDHIRGIPDLVRAFPPAMIWQYPAWASLRDHLARWSRKGEAGKREGRLQQLHEALRAIDALADETDCRQFTSITSRAWKPDPSADYEVQSIAPTNHDQRAHDDWVEGLFDIAEGRVRVDEKIVSWLLGEGTLTDAPNGLSLALSVSWRDRRLLLGGDVENGTGSPFSGWPGILQHLARPEVRLQHLVTGLELVKVAHHGSLGAFHPPAWELHGQGRERGPVALLTPFNKGASPLPNEQVLHALCDHASYLGITVNARRAFERAESGRWARVPGPPRHRKQRMGPVVAAVFEGDGALRLHAADMGALFETKPRRTLLDRVSEELDS
ncbi:MBL fold metallo-hydrolase [Sorangium sp. So ce302]|uniref:MBL fold metallo-hydrolase n=1 Tax=Sorangium sp. So ce302 TaxID=3133297 RepID=UPI003F60F203